MRIHIASIHRFIFYLFLACIPNQLGIHFWPAWSMVLGRRVDYLSPTLYFTDILYILFCISAIADPAVRRFVSRPFRFTSAVVIVLVYILLNSVTASSPAIALYWWVRIVQMVSIIVYMYVVHYPFSTVAALLMFSATYSSILAILQAVAQHSVGGVFAYIGERTFSLDTPGIARLPVCVGRGSCIEWLRPYASFPHPNVLAGFLASTIPLSIFVHSSFKNRWLYVMVLSAMVLALIMTASRAAVLALFFVLMFWLIRARIVTRTVPQAVAFIGVVCFTALLFVRFGVMNGNPFMDESVVRRSQLLSDGLAVYHSSPFIGVGLGNFLVELPKVSSMRVPNFLQPIHSLYALLLVEVGALGCLALVMMFYFLIRSHRRINYQSHSMIARLPLFILLIAGIFDHYMLTLQQGRLMFAIAIGLFMQSMYVPDDKSIRA